MTHIPHKNNLTTNLLSGCFNNTTATYKFYWFLSILQSIEKGETEISKNIIFSRMIANAWYPINYFRISFGKQDKLQRAIESIKEIEKLTIDAEKGEIVTQLSETRNSNTLSQLTYFNKQVPHWFLSPWFPKLPNENDSQQVSRIYKESSEFNNQCLYALKDDTIVINPLWYDYLMENLKILKDFCLWNLIMFIQTKNPNVPDIPNKLIKQAVRNSLTNQRIKFWDIVIKELGTVDCIYTNKSLSIGDYAVEHFIPYSFVSHDLIWNLIPADKSFNSSKRDKLPSLDKYYDSFFNLQRKAVEIIKHKSPNNKFLQDYLTILPDIETSFTNDKFKDRIAPLITIASNNGFQFLL